MFLFLLLFGTIYGQVPGYLVEVYTLDGVCTPGTLNYDYGKEATKVYWAKDTCQSAYYWENALVQSSESQFTGLQYYLLTDDGSTLTIRGCSDAACSLDCEEISVIPLDCNDMQGAQIGLWGFPRWMKFSLVAEAPALANEDELMVKFYTGTDCGTDPDRIAYISGCIYVSSGRSVQYQCTTESQWIAQDFQNSETCVGYVDCNGVLGGSQMVCQMTYWSYPFYPDGIDWAYDTGVCMENIPSEFSGNVLLGNTFGHSVGDGRYEVGCYSGMTPKNDFCPINSDDQTMCFDEGDCQGAECACYNGRAGFMCQTQLPLCGGYYSDDPLACSGNGLCVHDGVCACFEGYLPDPADYTKCIEGTATGDGFEFSLFVEQMERQNYKQETIKYCEMNAYTAGMTTWNPLGICSSHPMVGGFTLMAFFYPNLGENGKFALGNCPSPDCGGGSFDGCQWDVHPMLAMEDCLSYDDFLGYVTGIDWFVAIAPAERYLPEIPARHALITSHGDDCSNEWDTWKLLTEPWSHNEMCQPDPSMEHGLFQFMCTSESSVYISWFDSPTGPGESCTASDFDDEIYGMALFGCGEMNEKYFKIGPTTATNTQCSSKPYYFCGSKTVDDPEVCGGYGTCESDGGSPPDGVCNCPAGTTGLECETFSCGTVPYNEENTCGGNGICHALNLCLCEHGYMTGSNGVTDEGDPNVGYCVPVTSDQVSIIEGVLTKYYKADSCDSEVTLYAWSYKQLGTCIENSIDFILNGERWRAMYTYGDERTTVCDVDDFQHVYKAPEFEQFPLDACVKSSFQDTMQIATVVSYEDMKTEFDKLGAGWIKKATMVAIPEIDVEESVDRNGKMEQTTCTDDRVISYAEVILDGLCQEMDGGGPSLYQQCKDQSLSMSFVTDCVDKVLEDGQEEMFTEIDTCKLYQYRKNVDEITTFFAAGRITSDTCAAETTCFEVSSMDYDLVCNKGKGRCVAKDKCKCFDPEVKTPDCKPEQNNGAGNLSGGAIAGIVIGAAIGGLVAVILLIALIVGICLCICCAVKRAKGGAKMEVEMDTNE